MSRTVYLTVTAKNCDREVFRSGGKGGQNQNKVSSGVRWRHRASGAVGESRESRSQDENARIAWRRMAESIVFRAWVREQHLLADGMEDKVQRAMGPRFLNVEVRENGRWVPEGVTATL